MADAPTTQAAPPPATGPNTRAKGKAPEVLPVLKDVPPSTESKKCHLQKGRGCIASPDILDPPDDVEGEIVLKTPDVPPDVPQVQVEEPSPHHPAQCARTE